MLFDYVGTAVIERTGLETIAPAHLSFASSEAEAEAKLKKRPQRVC
jgi:hypothetical protein